MVIQNRASAINYFRALNLVKTNIYSHLVISKDAQKIAWAYSHLGKVIISEKKGEHTKIEKISKDWIIINPGDTFILKGRLCLYRQATIANIKNKVSAHSINFPRIIENVKQIAALGLTDKPYHIYLVKDKETGKAINLIMGAGDPFSFDHYMPCLQDVSLSPLSAEQHILEKKEFGDEFKIDCQWYAIMTYKGSLNISEISKPYQNYINDRRTSGIGFATWQRF